MSDQHKNYKTTKSTLTFIHINFTITIKKNHLRFSVRKSTSLQDANCAITTKFTTNQSRLLMFLSSFKTPLIRKPWSHRCMRTQKILDENLCVWLERYRANNYSLTALPCLSMKLGLNETERVI